METRSKTLQERERQKKPWCACDCMRCRYYQAPENRLIPNPYIYKCRIWITIDQNGKITDYRLQ